MHLEQIDHVALTCESPEATKDWYVSVLGFEHVYPGEWEGIPIFLRLGSTCIALFPKRGEATPTERPALRFDHLAFRARTYADFEAAREELRSLGIPHRFEDHIVSHSIYFADPNGHRLEITTYDRSKPK